MTVRLKSLHDKLQSLLKESETLRASEANDADRARVEQLAQDIEQTSNDIAKEKEYALRLQEVERQLNGGTKLESLVGKEKFEPTLDEKFAQLKNLRGRCRFMTGATEDEKRRKAYTFGRVLLAGIGDGNSRVVAESKKWLKDHYFAGHNELVPEDGGVLVPTEFENEMIVLRETYGVFRQYSRVTPMGSDNMWRPRRTGGLTAYFVADEDSITLSKAGWDRVELTARKLACLARWSSELSEDAIVDMGDTLAGEIAYAFAKKEDDCGFNGDNTSTYGNINGVRNRLKDVYGTGGGVGLPLATGNNAYSEVTLANLESVAGALPEYAETVNVAWFCSKAFWTNVLIRLALASGGTTAAEVVAGIQRRFMGRPVVISQQMPSTEANSQVPIVYGDLSLGSMFGDRRMTTIAVSEHSRFATDELEIRGTERFDINVHDVGDSSNAGPIVGLILAAS